MNTLFKPAGIAIFLGLSLLLSCSGRGQKQELAYLKDINERLLIKAMEQELQIRDYMISLAMVMDHLNAIKSSQNLDPGRLRFDYASLDVRGQLETDLGIIRNTMEDRNYLFDLLNQELQRSSQRQWQHEKQLDSLNLLLEDKTTGVLVLREFVEELQLHKDSLALKADELEAEKWKQQQLIMSLSQQNNTALFIFGKRRDLQELQVIDKKGGFLGIGSVMKVQPGMLNSPVIRLNIQDVQQLHLPGKRPRIVSTHPPGSYSIGQDAENNYFLQISDPGTFWAINRHLVVVVK